MITNEYFTCDFCHGQNGEFDIETGNHVACQKLAEKDAEIARLQKQVQAAEASKEQADKLLKDALDLFHGTLELCDDANSDEWIWKWRVRYYFEDTDIPVHPLPKDMQT